MKLMGLFLDPETRRLRAGWRAGLALLLSPPFLALLLPGGDSSAGREDARAFDASAGLMLAYGLLIGWMLLVSWVCLRFIEGMPMVSLGFAPHRGWWKDVGKGVAAGGSMIVAVVLLQMAGGGTRVKLNPIALEAPGRVLAQMAAALGLFMLAGAFEEMVYRGYAFQTLLRGTSAVVPILLFSSFFGLMHWNNPSRTFFSTANTVLAGIWLSLAYLKTRSLWFPTALHFTWNWALGACFGIPVSGLLVPRQPLLLSTSGEPFWLTGGRYGSEGGAATTLVLVLVSIVIWRAGWLSVSPEMAAALRTTAADEDAPLRLNLTEEG
ncbi:MAG: lysostaphin resistance A-like protein [Blastocatellia bacterium]